MLYPSNMDILRPTCIKFAIGDIISDILLYFINAFSHSNRRISCSDLSYTIEVGHSHMKGDLRLNHY